MLPRRAFPLQLDKANCTPVDAEVLEDSIFSAVSILVSSRFEKLRGEAVLAATLEKVGYTPFACCPKIKVVWVGNFPLIEDCALSYL